MVKSILRDTMFTRILGNKIESSGLFGVAMAAKTYDETEMHQAFVVNANSIGYTFGDDDRPERLVKSFFAATSAFLSKVKVSKVDEAVALCLTDVSGNFKFAGVVEYHDNKDNPDEPGNWSYVMTFDEKDINMLEKKKTVKKYLYSSDGFKNVYDKVAYDVGGISFCHEGYMFDACLLVIDTLIQILDREAVDNDVVDVELPKYFTASVSVENGEKIFAITPAGEMKEIIKNDTALDK